MRHFHAIVVLAALIEHLAIAQTAPRSVILFIGDGMGIAQTTLARAYQRNARDGKLTLDTLDQIAIVRTHAADRLVTDSAASATAYASGIKTNTLRVGVDPEGNPVQTILEKAKAAGKSVGVVTTTTVTHATPAAFYGHVPVRADEDDLAAQLIDYGQVDVVMGGGREFFLPRDLTDAEYGGNGRRRDSRNLIAEAQEKGYTFVQTRAEFDAIAAAAPSGFTGKVLALFQPGMMRYETERAEDVWGEPSLAEMTAAAIAILSRNPDGFFLMVEGGRIDHAGHDNRAKDVASETLAMDAAVKVAIEARAAAGDTLIVITADHETGGLAINGYPAIEVGGDALFTDKPMGGAPDIATFASGPGQDRAKMEGVDRAAREYRQPSLINLSSALHTGADVPLWATGPRADWFRGTLENDEVGRLLMKAIGLN